MGEVGEASMLKDGMRKGLCREWLESDRQCRGLEGWPGVG